MLIRVFGLVFLILLNGCISRSNDALDISSNPTPVAIHSADVLLEDLELAPELAESIWLNTENPLSLRDLQGKVVLIDFWTFG